MNLLPRFGPALFLVLTFAAPGFATRCRGDEPRYLVVDLGTLPGGRGTEPRSINTQGEVVGVTYVRGGPCVAFLYSDGTLTKLGEPHSEAWGINDHGEVAGFNMTADHVKHAVIWQTAGGKRGADPLDIGTGVARGINERGQVVGTFEGGSLRNPSAQDNSVGTIVRVEVPRLGSQVEQGAEVVAINGRGQVIGSVQGMTTEVYPVRGFLWEKGEVKDLGNLGGPHCHPYAINSTGQVVGSSSYDVVPRGIAPLYLIHAFLWERGKMRDLRALRDGKNSAALGLNNRGQVVGWSETEAGSAHPADRGRVAFLLSDGTMYDLNRLVPPDSGWMLKEARAINDQGQIVGVGANGGQERGFLLSP